MTAKALVEFLYSGKKRKTGDPACTHPIAVMQILKRQGVENASLLDAALLHDVLEDFDLDKQYLHYHFGKKVSDIVEILSKMKKWNTSYCRMKEALDDLAMHFFKYPEACLIKIADRQHNLMTVHGFSPEKQAEYYHETQNVLIPFFEEFYKQYFGAYKQVYFQLMENLKKETQKLAPSQ